MYKALIIVYYKNRSDKLCFIFDEYLCSFLIDELSEC